jgi:tetratricopeptide (TPR) repeat protein
MSPIYPPWYHLPIAWTYYTNGDYAAALAEAKKADTPDYYWKHQLLAAIYGAMGRREDARVPLARLLELYPAFPSEVRQIWKKWNVPDFVIDKVVTDLRRAGLNIPDQEPSKHGATTSNITLNRSAQELRSWVPVALRARRPVSVSVGRARTFVRGRCAQARGLSQRPE